MKRQIRPRRITIELLINVKGINVIPHGLRPLPINRCTFIFRQAEGTFIICYSGYDNANKNKLGMLFILFFIFDMKTLTYHLSCLRRFFPSQPSSEIHYIRRDIMS
jgi:hypothetical protein